MIRSVPAGRRFLRHPGAIGGAVVLSLIVCLAILAFLSPYDPQRNDVMHKLQPPSLLHPCGTDSLGRDVLTRLLYGARISLVVGLATTCISLGIGVPTGILAGYFGGSLDDILMRATDTFLSFPSLFVLILISSLLRETGLPAIAEGQPLVIAFTIGSLSWMTVARLVRASALSLRERNFVVAAHSIGVPYHRIMIRHILPNTLGPVIVEATLLVASAIIVEAGLSFIGFGVHARTPTWGNMLAEGQAYLSQCPWLSFFPGFLIFATAISINYIGDGIRDATDPRSTLEPQKRGRKV